MALNFEGNKLSRAFSSDFNNMAYVATNAVTANCEVTESSVPAMTVDVAAGSIFFGNDTITVTAQAGNVIGANSTGLTRIDLVAIDNTGTVSIIAGTASSLPATPDYDPDNYIILARVEVISGATTILDASVIDTRVFNIGGAGGSGGGTFLRHVESFTAETTVIVLHNLGDDEPVFKIYDATGVAIEESDITSVTIDSVNQLTVVFAGTESGKIVVIGGTGVNNAYYKTTFSSSASIAVAHNLNNQYVNVTIYDSSDELLAPSKIEFVDEDNLTITLGIAASGTIAVTGGVSDNGNTISPSTNTDEYVPQWDGANSKTLKNGLAVGTSASNLVQLDVSAKLPAVDGSQLTNISAGSILAGYDATGGSHGGDTVETEVGASGAVTSGKTNYVIKAFFTITRIGAQTADCNATVRLKRGTTFGGSATFKTETLNLIPIPANSNTVYQANENIQTVFYVETTGGNYSGTEKVYASAQLTGTVTGVTVECKWIEVIGY